MIYVQTDKAIERLPGSFKTQKEQKDKSNLDYMKASPGTIPRASNIVTQTDARTPAARMRSVHLTTRQSQ